MQRVTERKDKYDKTGTRRQSRRNQQLEQVARDNGFGSLSKMLTEIMKGQAIVIKVVKNKILSREEKS